MVFYGDSLTPAVCAAGHRTTTTTLTHILPLFLVVSLPPVLDRSCPPAIYNSKKGGNHPQFTPKVAELFGKIQAQHLTKSIILWALNSVFKVKLVEINTTL